MNETETRLSSSRDHWLARMRRKVDLVPLWAETRPNGGEKQEIGRREQVRPPIHSYLKRRQRQQTPLTVIATHARRA
jgi:hypothetical protein